MVYGISSKYTSKISEKASKTFIQSSVSLHSINVFLEKMGELDADEFPCQPWTNKIPKVLQPDLNYLGK